MTVVGAQKECKSQAMILFKGNMNKKNIWERKFFIKILVEVDIIVLDNVDFHKDGVMVIREAGCGLCICQRIHQI